MAAGRQILFAVAILAMVAIAVPSSALAEGRALFKHRWISTKVLRDGTEHELVDRTHIRLDMWRGRARDGIGWKCGCNDFWGDLEVTPTRLRVSVIGQTLAGCERARLRQDRQVERFFERDPRWARSGAKLRLRAHGDVIEFGHRR
jgi:hypothetical protein